jgi:hypothetical protein
MLSLMADYISKSDAYSGGCMQFCTRGAALAPKHGRVMT